MYLKVTYKIYSRNMIRDYGFLYLIHTDTIRRCCDSFIMQSSCADNTRGHWAVCLMQTSTTGDQLMMYIICYSHDAPFHRLLAKFVWYYGAYMGNPAWILLLIHYDITTIDNNTSLQLLKRMQILSSHIYSNYCNHIKFKNDWMNIMDHIPPNTL
jgi:hypothetical protein